MESLVVERCGSGTIPPGLCVMLLGTFTCLLDADIEPAPGMLRALREKMRREGIPFVSVTAFPSMSGAWGRLLMPAFVYFFMVLYPFWLVNSSNARVAAAAGGCILTESRLLEQMGRLESLRSTVIDDCTLARGIKSDGSRIWLGLPRSARSIRNCRHLGELWNVVARTAFTQLGYSAILLVLCTLVMALAYGVPAELFVFSDGLQRYLSAAALFVMMITYVLVLRFHERSWLWALSLPLIGALFLP
ncbi:MAG TPA: glycosyltransferase [Candidatus Acidoferrales bacterium]|nr:glycosyltransferase [Candidatus Acidoferrales bacterium]